VTGHSSRLRRARALAMSRPVSTPGLESLVSSVPLENVLGHEDCAGMLLELDSLTALARLLRHLMGLGSPIGTSPCFEDPLEGRNIGFEQSEAMAFPYYTLPETHFAGIACNRFPSQGLVSEDLHGHYRNAGCFRHQSQFAMFSALGTFGSSGTPRFYHTSA
jgi:hypothetical protein